MSRKKASGSSANEGNNSNIAIIVAVIGLIGTIITAVLGYLASTRPTDAEIAIMATQTAVAKSTLEAQTSVLATSPITMTPSTPTGTSSLSNLLSKGCINSAAWFSLNKEQGETCLSLDQYGISANNNGFTFSFTNDSSEKIRHGIFTPIEKGTQIRLKLSISNLYTPYENNLANLSLGVMSMSLLNPEKDTLLIYQRESPQAGYPIFIKKEENGNFDAYLSQNGSYRKYTKNTIQEILLDISDTDQLTIYIDGSPVIQEAVPFQDKVFWIGYRLSANCQINADISDLQIQTQ